MLYNGMQKELTHLVLDLKGPRLIIDDKPLILDNQESELLKGAGVRLKRLSLFVE